MVHHRANQRVRIPIQPNTIALAKSLNHGVPLSSRMRGLGRDDRAPFLPTEDWYEPSEVHAGHYRIVVKPPGAGYRHAVTPGEIRRRLSELPPWMLRPLEVVQLSSMTRKKRTFPCYGMQWGTSLYLYPIEDSLIEQFDRPPKPAVYNEARMFGGRWQQLSDNAWQLVWTQTTLRDFYLNNILIHELGHLLDNRNTSYVDRERFAEWFAIRHGYQASKRAELARTAARRPARRRHHTC
jgi:hypothetical protein